MSSDEATIKRLMEENQRKLKILEKKIRFNKFSYVLTGAILGFTACYMITRLAEVYLP